MGFGGISVPGGERGALKSYIDTALCEGSFRREEEKRGEVSDLDAGSLEGALDGGEF